LCISDDGFICDTSTKELTVTALAECPGMVIQLDNLNHYQGDPTGQAWNSERPCVTEEFIKAYVKVWRNGLPEEAIIVNTNAYGFKESLPIDINSFIEAIDHPETFPSKSLWSNCRFSSDIFRS
jgi:hypothetical protein